MTYEEVLIEKQKAETNEPNVTFIIAPALHDEYERFVNSYDEETYSDEDCKVFSTNKEYIVAIILP